MRIHWTLILTLSFITSAFSQVNPPEFTCLVGNGTEYEVSWTPPAVTCGALTGYVFYYSTTEAGPYQSFNINNPAATDTIFASLEQNLFCYMESVMDCPGQQVIASDTLIFSLAPPEMKSVSVNPGTGIVEVTWFPSPSPDIAAYLVYVDGANFPDTVWGNNSNVYLDFVSNASISAHNYKLAWFRNCANDGDRRGTIGEAYQSIFADNLQQDECDRSFLFRWTSYQNYTAGIDGYEIEVSTNNGPYEAIDTVPTSQQIYSFPNAIKNNYYCFRVNALLPNGCVASSNVLCDTARVVEIPQGGHIRNVTVVGNNIINLHYYPDTSGVAERFRAQRTESGINFQDWPTNLIGTSGNPVYEIHQDVNSLTNAKDYWYRFYREDECGNEYVTDSAKSILLIAKIGAGFSGKLRWTPFMISNGDVLNYSISRIVNGDTTQIATVGPSILEYIDDNALDPATLDTVCYLVTAEVDQNIPGRASGTIYSNSNVDCLEPIPRIITPTAFAPEGFNTVFLPIISFGTGEQYQFRIWDRWGKLLFETDNPNLGWNGRYKGEVVMMDSYTFFVSFVGQDGLSYSKAGSVVVVR